MKSIFSLSIAALALVMTLASSGCSVFMAAKQPSKKDVSVLREGTRRSLVLAEFGHPVASEKNDEGRVDVYKFTQGYSSGAKAGRAMIHGAADVVTLGLWEVVGTPTEAAFDGREMAVEIQYDENDIVKTVIPLTKETDIVK